REAQTTVRLQPGEALTIGGLIDREEQINERRVPILSEIPILGRLFRTTEHTKNNAEIMITITADLLPERPPQP
ncbi:MAG: bacterial type II/III secretion system short domain protein, partial [Negativicoccus succinicivorans]|nr:bacterial type II/III secretion system short domain protein [Negativicoccus succinicivorans]